MLDLNSSVWQQLQHAYGKADDLPELLRQLEERAEIIPDDYQDEPWFSLWSSLCHQGDVYTASYAAVPHIVRIALSTGGTPYRSFFDLPTSIEIARLKRRGPIIPAELSQAYFGALQQLHELAHKLAAVEWSDELSRSIAAALIASKGHALLAETITDLSPETIREFRIHQSIEEVE